MALLLAGCGSSSSSADGGDDRSSRPPYFLLRDEGWELVDASESPGALDALGIIWNLSYDRDAGAGRRVSAALALLEADKAEELGRQVVFVDTEVTVDDEVVAVWTERSPQADRLIATHLRWKAGVAVAWLTVYETAPPEALLLVETVEGVSEAAWDAAVADVLDAVGSTPEAG